MIASPARSTVYSVVHCAGRSNDPSGPWPLSLKDSTDHVHTHSGAACRTPMAAPCGTEKRTCVPTVKSRKSTPVSPSDENAKPANSFKAKRSSGVRDSASSSVGCSPPPRSGGGALSFSFGVGCPVSGSSGGPGRTEGQPANAATKYPIAMTRRVRCSTLETRIIHSSSGRPGPGISSRGQAPSARSEQLPGYYRTKPDGCSVDTNQHCRFSDRLIKRLIRFDPLTSDPTNVADSATWPESLKQESHNGRSRTGGKNQRRVGCRIEIQQKLAHCNLDPMRPLVVPLNRP